MARSMTARSIFGATTLIIAISACAALLPTVSIMRAAFKVKRRVVVAKDGEGTDDSDPRRVARHQDHRLLLVARRVRVGLAHQDENLAARVHRARGPPFARVDDVAAVALAADRGFDVGGVR